MNARTRKTLLLSAKIAVAGALLAWVIAKVHWRDYVHARDGGGAYAVVAGPEAGTGDTLRVDEGSLWSPRIEVRPVSDFKPVAPGQVIRPGFATSLKAINVALAAAGAMAFGLALAMIAVRWRMLLKIQDVNISLWEAIRLTFLGQFFNAIVPGTVGGDLVKVYYVAKHTPKVAAVLVSVFVDRLLGLVELALMAGAMLGLLLLGGERSFDELRLPVICMAAIILAVGGMMTFLLSQRFRRALHLEKLYRRLPIAHHIAAAGDAAVRYRRRLGAMAWAVAISLVSHLSFVAFVALMGASLSIPAGWKEYFLYVPLIYIIGAIPLTPGGVGWVENWYLRFFESPVCGASTILVLALLARLVPMLWGLPGAVVAVTGARVPRPEVIEAELSAGQRAGK
ncbi:MAG: flippase-like domain-containing protein [Phycisphaerae bacterium]|nr:flippase-like domain-containing protein [Phycisphaerae bacterium]